MFAETDSHLFGVTRRWVRSTVEVCSTCALAVLRLRESPLRNHVEAHDPTAVDPATLSVSFYSSITGAVNNADGSPS